MAEPEASDLIPDLEGVSAVDFAAQQTKSMQEESLGDNPSKKKLRMCPDDAHTADTPPPAHQAIVENSPPNTKLTLDPVLWNDTTREVYEHLKIRGEKLEDATNKDTPKSDAPSADGPQGNIYETLLSTIQSTLKRLRDQQEGQEMEQPCAEPTSSPLSSLTSSRLPSPCAEEQDDSI